VSDQDKHDPTSAGTSEQGTSSEPALQSATPASPCPHAAQHAQAPAPCSEDEGLTTGDMARLSNTTLRTVRFYEQEGLISSQAREDGCHRKFPKTELRKLQMISDLREAGLSLNDIKTLIGLKRKCNTPQTAACQMSEVLGRCIQELQQRIDTLARLRSELSSTIATIRNCRDCKEPSFPAGCSDCDVPDTSRTTELLWKN
jgi:DNA-binding transcriptional MerR regulator